MKFLYNPNLTIEMINNNLNKEWTSRKNAEALH